MNDQENISIDEQLIRQAKDNRSLFAYVYDRYYKQIFVYFLRRTGRYESAEDLTQDTFFQAFKFLDKFQYRQIKYISYLLTIAHNLLINFYKKSGRIIDIEDMSIFCDSNYIINYENLCDKIDFKIRIEKIWLLSKKLSNRERKVFLFKYKKDMSTKEIAMSMNKSVNSVKLLLCRGRKKIR